MALIDKKPEYFNKYDIKKLKELPLEAKLKVFYGIDKYPDTTWFYHNILGVGVEKKLPFDEKLEFWKHLCEKDLFYFAKYILRKNLLREKPNREMAEKIMIRHQPEDQERKLICEPRGTYKSTLASIAYSVWRLSQNRNLSILIDSETDGQAKDLYLPAKEEMEINEILIKIWGEFKSNRWNEHRLFVKGRTNIRRDPSLFHSGTETSINGVHPDIIICDDPCSDVNTQTIDQRDKTDNHCKLFTPLLDKKGELLYICTRWAMDDQAGRMLKREKDTFSIISVKGCYGENGEGKSWKDGLYAPEILSKKFLENAKKTMGMWRFSANYMNNPQPDTDKSFRLEWLRYYDTPMPTRFDEDGIETKVPLSIYISIDAGWADKTSNTGRDPTAIVVGGFSSEGDLYVLEIINKKMSPTDIIEEIFNLYSKWKPNAVCSEDIGAQKGINKLLEDEMLTRKIHFTLDRVKHQQQAKGSRIAGLQPMFENNYIFLPEEGMDEFIDQYINFSPASKLAHDDILDALEMLVSEYRDIFIAPEQTEEDFIDEEYDIYCDVTGRS
jgi:predicted phage terminase large subunit-like protein